jgi:Ca2+-binding RTX toxin-like protein
MSSIRQRRRLFFEGLEPRQLLAADLLGGVLTVVGTNRNDRIYVTLSEPGTLLVSVNSQRSQFNLADVSQLRISGGRGNDTIGVAEDVPLAAWISGGAGDDRLKGSGGNDEIHGDAGNDRIDGGGGDDAIFGEAGNDRVDGGAGNDDLNGGAGQDELNGGGGDDVLLGGIGNDKLCGGEGDDEVVGGAGNDHLEGNGGDDHLSGEAGNDRLNGGDGDDFLEGGNGNDRLDGGYGENLLDGGSGKNKEKNGTHVTDDTVVLYASFTTGNGSLKATFRSEPREGEAPLLTLSVRVQNGTPGASLGVVIDGFPMASLLLDGQGNGTIGFTNQTGNEDPNSLPFPAGLALHAGSTILVGSLSAVFVAV